MATLTHISADDDARPGNPIGALVIAIPLSLLLWGAVVFVMLKLVH